jgi:hypothetical protein
MQGKVDVRVDSLLEGAVAASSDVVPATEA